MKTKTFFLLCFLTGIGLTQLSAQNSNSDGTYTVIIERHVNWMAPIYCEGVEIDRIVNSYADARIIKHYKDNILQFTYYFISGQGESTKTDEIFTFNEHVKYTDQEPYTCHTHLKGDCGTVYNISLLIDSNNNWEVKNATCAGKNK
jgi:hypothetical protein